ncbi:AcrR family transcriptional regulator [Hamadaea flava]|uniref:TetR/AcrR family transcriptional regulator n=1 Tax=Hamadaea flava TaxID=1742688 RepID=A0ABV8LMK2_9ACTN|nr:TetR/AcrR family transcriptional regulator [Hamadaea flava]MCP2321495.1 AcrR family transcriptional regulator [Hamadaea flava]
MTEPIWLRPERGARGPRPTHRRTDIAATAVRLADAEGLDGVSLRRVAAELGTGPATLYRYITNKDELFDLMVDAVLGEAQPPEPSGDWRADVSAVAVAQRELALRHPWLAGLPATRPSLGPNGLAWQEATYATLTGLGLSADETLLRVQTVLTFVRGQVIEELAEREAARRSGQDLRGWLDTQSAYGESIIGSGRYPQLSRIMLEAATPHADDRFDRLFQYGLERVLTGIGG